MSRDGIIDGMTQAIWASSYADYVESLTKPERDAVGAPVNLDGVDWIEDSPEPPEAAERAGRELVALYESENDASIEDLENRAHADDDEEFGRCLAEMAMGTGSSWFDDHARFELAVPLLEAHYDGEFFEWSGRCKTTMTNPASGELNNIFLQKERGGWHVEAEYPDGNLNYGPFKTKERGMRMREAVIESDLQRNPSRTIGHKYALGSYAPGSRVQLGEWKFPAPRRSKIVTRRDDPGASRDGGTLMPGEWVVVIRNGANVGHTVTVKIERTGAIVERDALAPLFEVDVMKSNLQRNPPSKRRLAQKTWNPRNPGDLDADIDALAVSVSASDFWKASHARQWTASVDHGYSDGKGRVGGAAVLTATSREDQSGEGRRAVLVLAVYIARNGSPYGKPRGGFVVVDSVDDATRMTRQEFARQAAHYERTRYKPPERNPGALPELGDIVHTKHFQPHEVVRVCRERDLLDGDMIAVYLKDDYGGELRVTPDEIESIERRNPPSKRRLAQSMAYRRPETEVPVPGELHMVVGVSQDGGPYAYNTDTGLGHAITADHPWRAAARGQAGQGHAQRGHADTRSDRETRAPRESDEYERYKREAEEKWRQVRESERRARERESAEAQERKEREARARETEEAWKRAQEQARERVNGYPIVDFIETGERYGTSGRKGRYILVDRGDRSLHRWVTAHHWEGDTSWDHGNYFDNLGEAKADLQERAAAKKQQKQQYKSPPPPKKPGSDPRTVLGFSPGERLTTDMVKKRHRELARQHHPDMGGSTAKMQEINRAVDELMSSGTVLGKNPGPAHTWDWKTAASP